MCADDWVVDTTSTVVGFHFRILFPQGHLQIFEPSQRLEPNHTVLKYINRNFAHGHIETMSDRALDLSLSSRWWEIANGKVDAYEAKDKRV